MMGERRVMQEALFYGFSVERHVPEDYMLRKIDRFVDLPEVRAHLEPYYSETGRPSIDPELSASTARRRQGRRSSSDFEPRRRRLSVSPR